MHYLSSLIHWFWRIVTSSSNFSQRLSELDFLHRLFMSMGILWILFSELWGQASLMVLNKNPVSPHSVPVMFFSGPALHDTPLKTVGYWTIKKFCRSWNIWKTSSNTAAFSAHDQLIAWALWPFHVDLTCDWRISNGLHYHCDQNENTDNRQRLLQPMWKRLFLFLFDMTGLKAYLSDGLPSKHHYSGSVN